MMINITDDSSGTTEYPNPGTGKNSMITAIFDDTHYSVYTISLHTVNVVNIRSLPSLWNAMYAR